MLTKIIILFCVVYFSYMNWLMHQKREKIPSKDKEFEFLFMFE